MKRLFLIESTDVTIADCMRKGYWSRQRGMLSEYAKQFEVYYYTSDRCAMPEAVPPGVVHRVSPFGTDIYGLRHLVFYSYLVLQSFTWRTGPQGLIRLLGVTLPVVPLIKRISGRKVVLSFHYDWARQTQQNYKRKLKVYSSNHIQRSSLQAADRVICTMDWLQQVARDEYGKTSTPVIPNFVDTSLFKPTLPKKKQIVFVGRLHWSKGADLLIEAFQRFHESHPEFVLVVLGDGEERAKLEKLAANSRHIVFKGSVPIAEVAATLNESEIFVLPTRTMEGHARALVEAMAAGCKCITSNVTGNREVLLESQSAELLFRAGDVDDLVAKLNHSQRYAAGTQLDFARTHYASDVLFAKELELINDLL
jgi:glycosyltransferase involved in cell wall biosynthesis